MFQNCSCSDDDVTNYVNFLKNFVKNWLNYDFFCKTNLATAKKRFPRSFIQLLKLKVQIEYI